MKAMSERALFYSVEPTELSLKKSALLWKIIKVSPGFFEGERFSDNLANNLLLLLDEDILKVENDYDDWDLYDKVYCTLNSELHNYLIDNKKRVSVIPYRPSDFGEIVERATQIDEKDKTLRQLRSELRKMELLEEGVFQNPRFFGVDFTSSGGQELIRLGLECAERIETVRKKIDAKINWKSVNSYIVEKIVNSSAVLVDKYTRIIYAYKFSGLRYDIERIELPLKVDRTFSNLLYFLDPVPFESLTIEEIIELRKSKYWEEGTNQLINIAKSITTSPENETFDKEATLAIGRTFQEAFEEFKPQHTHIINHWKKQIAGMGITFIPIVGPFISKGLELIDPVIDYLKGRKKINRLVLFVDDIKYRYSNYSLLMRED